MHTLKKPTVNALSMKSVLRALDRHVQVAECVVRGYLTMYQDLMVLVETTVRHPTKLQLEACLRETEKLSMLLETASPRALTDLSLSMLISASPVHEPIAEGSASGIRARAATVGAAMLLSLALKLFNL